MDRDAYIVIGIVCLVAIIVVGMLNQPLLMVDHYDLLAWVFFLNLATTIMGMMVLVLNIWDRLRAEREEELPPPPHELIKPKKPPETPKQNEVPTTLYLVDKPPMQFDPMPPEQFRVYGVYQLVKQKQKR